MRARVSVLLATAFAAAASTAHAQTQTPQSPAPPAANGKAPAKPAAAPAKKAQPAAKTVDEVTVTGASTQGFRSSIDRRSYGIAQDLATTTGTISDALKNIPSVEVDVQGNVSLRGDTNVTILVDGKPSALFRGQSAAQALQSLPADSVERVEVITNPSAEFSPDGSAGIINLVMKKVHRVGESGSVRYNVGTAGRRNGGVSGAYSSDALTLSGDAGFRHDPQHPVTVDQRSQFDASGNQLSNTRETIDNRGPLDQWNARGGLDYDLNKKDRLSAEIHANQTELALVNLTDLEGLDPKGLVNEKFDQSGLNKSVRDNLGANASWRHTTSYDDELSASASHETTFERGETEFTAVESEPPEPDLFQDIRGHNRLDLTDLRADMRRPLPGDAKLKAGYELRIDDNSYDSVAERGTAAANAGPDPTLTNLFLYKQTINSGYVTYERPFGDWTVLGGLRVEDVEQDLNQVTTAIVHNSNYLRAYPTLHLNYRWSDSQQITLSYSRRIQRPNPSDLNPFRIEQDQFNFRAGNPGLKPERTDSFEAGWQYRAGGTFYLATAYYRVSANDFTDVISDVGGGALLATKENLASSKHAGLELVANGHLTKDLSYNVSTNVYYAEIDPGNFPLATALGILGDRSAIEGGGRFSLNWNATTKDVFQASGQMNARRLTPQGYSDPQVITFLGYRHKVTDQFAVVFNVQDAFNTFNARNFINTPQLRDRSISTARIQAAYLGFSWNFGSPPKPTRPPPPPPEPEPEAIHG
ncbi:TonB-dependent receptor domain-containing protein [Phenylobacterium sp.]|uniref:TonB-dependent receptor domain-containing protein n=1 Tax=Phenylobacterium sp. TaxID=1871053 RepID=UPI002C3DA205|nr:TonB-dependent receptor [Phenylobacterium sp.]HLZ77006.1 TonB-dependent receptor [Phenylobacterium sp.]